MNNCTKRQIRKVKVEIFEVPAALLFRWLEDLKFSNC
jgi:hypothetical protein